MQLEIEREALKKETDDARKARLDAVDANSPTSRSADRA